MIHTFFLSIWPHPSRQNLPPRFFSSSRTGNVFSMVMRPVPWRTLKTTTVDGETRDAWPLPAAVQLGHLDQPPRSARVISTHDGPKNPYIPQFLHTILGPDYYTVPPRYYGWTNVISNQDPRWTQKPIYTPIFTHHIRSWLFCTPLIVR